MLITYFIILIITLVFKALHWPGVSILLLISPLFPLIDILVQSIRKNTDKETRILSAVGLFFLSLFFLFKFLYWPGSSLWFVISMILFAVYVLRYFQKKFKYNRRYVLVGILILFAVFNFSLKRSDFRLAYQMEDPFNPADPVPHFYVQALAHDYYLEGDFDKATKLIERNINHINFLLDEKNVPHFIRKIDEENLKISVEDLSQIKNRTWRDYQPLFPEDRSTSEFN